MSMSGLDAQLRAGAQDLGIVMDDKQASRLLKLLAEVLEWNERFNLTAITEPAEMLRKHLLDSLSIHSHLHGQRIADVGAGAGFPGLPLAILNPGRHFSLIESTGKKARFLEHVVSSLELVNVTVVNSRAEAWNPVIPFDSVVARALGKVGEFIRVAGHLCGRRGRLLAMKGQYPQAELESLPGGWKLLAVHEIQVPGLDAARHLVELGRA